MRLDIYLTQATGRSRQQIKKFIKEGKVKVSGRVVVKPSFLLEANKKVEYDLPPPFVLQPPKPEAMPLEILYDDEQIAVVNKPAGLVVHPALKSPDHTLAHGLLARFGALPVIDDPMKPGIVHRLDKGTSGCLVVAKTKEALLDLQRQFKAREIEKIYLALVVGRPKPEGRIEKKIGWHSKRRYKISSHTKKGKEAITTWKVLETFGQEFSWVQIQIFTGRTHQIRVHFAEAGHPVVGDPTYGKRAKVLQKVPGTFLQNNKRGCNPLYAADTLAEESAPSKKVPGTFCCINRPALHAWRLGLVHPQTKERLTFEAPLPQDLEKLLQHLRTNRC